MKTVSSSASSSSSDMLSVISSVHVWLSKHLHSDNLSVAYRRANYVQRFNAKIAVLGHCWKFRQRDTNSTICTHISRNIFSPLYIASPINVPVSMSRITLAMSSARLENYAISLTIYQLPNYLHAQASSKCTYPMTCMLKSSAVLHREYMSIVHLITIT